MTILITGAVAVGEAQASAGDLDRSFAHDGKALRDLGFEGDDEAVDVAVHRNLKPVVVGDTMRGRKRAVTVTRFRRDGRIDRRFGKRGTAVIRIGGWEQAAAVEIQPNGRIVVAFTSAPSFGQPAFGIARLRRNGKPDRSLDRDGIQTANFGEGAYNATANDLALGSDGDIVVAGSVLSSAGGTNDDFAVARFTADGELDEGFSGDGLQTTDFEGENDVAYAVDIDSEGRVVAAGADDAPGCCTGPLAIARYGTDGELDPSFSDDGRLTSLVSEEAADVVALPDGRIAVAGSVAGDFLVARFAVDGTPDTTFAGDGAQTIDFADGVDEARTLTVIGKRILVGGTARTHRRERDFAIARLRANGELDSKFSDDGRRAIDFARDGDAANGLALDRRKRIVAAGSAIRPRGTDTAVVRLMGTGRRR